jgi:RNA polymerase sigma-70 factor (ECF subfamily)
MEREIVALMPAMRAFAFRFAHSTNDADDLVQEAVTRALGHLDSFKLGTSMRSWLFTIVRNIYCTGYNKTLRESCGRLCDVATYETAALGRQEWSMRASDVEVALLRLNARERTALLLVAEGISYIDAAANCGCEVGTIKSRVSRARVHLATLLGEADPLEAVSIN